MNIAIDIDDTLADSFEYFMPFVAEYFGMPLEEVRERNISYSTLLPEWKERELDFCKKYYGPNVPDTPFKPGAAEAVRKLREMGHRIVIITGRTPDFYEDPYETTRKELENGGIVYDKLICTIDKDAACMAEKIDVLIDDLPKNCRAAAACGVKPILFTSKANRDAEVPFPRVNSWDEAMEAIAEYEENRR